MCIFGLIRELKHSNLNVRHWHLTSNSSLLGDVTTRIVIKRRELPGRVMISESYVQTTPIEEDYVQVSFKKGFVNAAHTVIVTKE